MALQTLQGNALNLGATSPGGTVTIKPATLKQILLGGIILARDAVTGTIDGTGFFSVQVSKGADVVVTLKDTDNRTFFHERIVISGDDTVDLSSYFDDPAALADLGTIIPDHASQHFSTGNDPITPANIGAIAKPNSATNGDFLAWDTGTSTWLNTKKIGDGTNYTEFEADGTVKFVGTATTFDDLLGPFTTFKSTGPGVSLNDTELTIDFLQTSDTADYAFTSYQQSHRRKVASALQPHIHWEQTQNKVPNFLLQYRYQVNGGTKVTGWTNYKCNTTAFTYTSGTLNQVCYGADLIPISESLSDILQIRLIRDNSNTSTLFAGVNNYTATVSCTSVDIHYETDTAGSRTPFSK